jgi:hypothetical protein
MTAIAGLLADLAEHVRAAQAELAAAAAVLAEARIAERDACRTDCADTTDPDAA